MVFLGNQVPSDGHDSSDVHDLADESAEPMVYVVQSGKARGIAAAISGGFAIVWFGWGMAALASGPVLTGLQVGRVLAAVVILLGVVLAVRSPAGSTPMSDPAVARRYGYVVLAEFSLLGVGNIVLANIDGAQWIPVWVCAGVGLHFIPMARVFKESSLLILAAMMTLTAALAVVMSQTTDVAPGTVTGTGGGLCLLVSAAVTLAARRFYSWRPTATH